VPVLMKLMSAAKRRIIIAIMVCLVRIMIVWSQTWCCR
jgi:hypothetical protein